MEERMKMFDQRPIPGKDPRAKGGSGYSGLILPPAFLHPSIIERLLRGLRKKGKFQNKASNISCRFRGLSYPFGLDFRWLSPLSRQDRTGVAVAAVIMVLLCLIFHVLLYLNSFVAQ
ncbi:hypothetical protein BU24DRAFT_420282 [Aaosphaeria arxii CBS 175.79]|uniref:Uncharacterized protein n=1 Tax=Aaosphaeria arxii CBS 175.79 TaxID=1450172 RepID=A0A6A5XWE4_9PLEO|nr:uncharacterized protein BU24DRAFT_420282 [Aaosphaeria arxii CBS 175.79]KAF2017243.1 hypothetical protein BU24DRAFT_420282 [Aaosphaeria arxii CBS 175.79]